MGQDRPNTILIRLKAALLLAGATNAAARLDAARPILAQGNDDGIQSLALRHCREYGLDPAWILGGQEQAAAPPGPCATLTPVFAMSATHPVTGRWQLREIERIALAPPLLGPSRFVIRMDSRALEPRIRQGAYLVVDTDQDAASGTGEDVLAAPFAMDIQGEGLVVRLLRYDSRMDRLELSALDHRTPSLTLSRDAEQCRVVGRVVWVAQML